MDDTSVSPPTPPNPSAATPPDPNNHTNHMLRAVIIWIVCSVVLMVALILAGPHLSSWGVLPPFASNQSNDIYSVMFLFTLLAVPVFCLVVVFGGYSAFNFTRRQRPADGGFQPAGLPIQVTWVVVSVLLVSFLYVYGLTFLSKVDASPGSNALVVDVTGEQWLWDYSYPQYGNIQSSVLELPVNQPVVFKIQSVDVQHSFWIPAFGIKQDAVPGEITSTTATPTQMGTYVVRCAELCGLYHAYMQTPVYVVSASTFQAWVGQQPTPVPASSSSFVQPNALPAETLSRTGGYSASTAEG
ncbi:MAG: cytochrome c oxidase subunit II [Ktedonobacterales bacterium]